MRLVRIVVSLFIAMCVFYLATPTIIQFMCLPVADYLPKGDDGMVVLNVLDVFGSFTIRFKVALWASVVACMPIILWQILAFFLPALKPNERKWFIPTFAVGVFLFMFGTVFCYLFILNPAVQWAHRPGWRFRANPARRQGVGRCHHQLRAVLRRRVRVAARCVLPGHFRHRAL